MSAKAANSLFLTVAAATFNYCLRVLYSSQFFFRSSKRGPSKNFDLAPSVSILKPVRGLDPEAYENYASFCRQDYPSYELIFCVGDFNDPARPVLQKFMRDFPRSQIRLRFCSGRSTLNHKVAKLLRIANQA